MDTLNLTGVQTIGVNHIGHGTQVVAAKVTEQPAGCPECSHTDLYAFGTRKTRYIDLPSRGEHVLIDLTRQRYRCRKCSHTFMPGLTAFDGQWRLTRRATAWIEESATRRTFTGLAQEIGITEKAIRNVFWRYAQQREKELVPTAGPVIGIDELYLLKKHRCILTNLRERTVIDLLPGRKYPEVFRYLKRLDGADKIERVCIDMWRPYKEAVHAALPKAAITIDRFHVVKEANRVIENIRKSFQRTIQPGQRLDLMRSRFILLKRKADLGQEESEKIVRWRKLYPSLIEAWELKEEFFDIYLQPDVKAAEKEYTRWFDHLPLTSHSQFRELVKTIDHWRPEIFNYFDSHITNAYTECANGLAKIMNRQGRGHSFDVIRYKLLFQHKKQRFVQLSVKAKLANIGIPFSTFDDVDRDIDKFAG